MKKRVAVQFVGHLRSFKKTFKTFRANIIDQNEKCGISIDVFIHTWDELEHTDTPGHYKIDKSRVGKPLTDKDLKWVQNNYKPKSIMIGKQQALTTKETEIAAKHNIHGKVSKNMCLTFYQSNVLREKYEQEHCFKYDLVIVTRPDIIFYKKLDVRTIFRDFTEDEIENTIFFVDVPNVGFIDSRNVNLKKYICGIDLFMLCGSPAVSKIAHDWREKKRYLIEPSAESNITQIIVSNNLSVNLIQYPKHFCWNIKRTNEIKDYLLFRPFVFVLNIFYALLRPILIYSTLYQKDTFIGGYEVLAFSKRIARYFCLPFLILIKKWLKK